MILILIVIISLLCSSVRSDESVLEDIRHSLPLEQQKIQVERLFSSLITNLTERTVSGEIQAKLFYNQLVGQTPPRDIRNDLNVTGLTPEEVRIVMAFPNTTVYGQQSVVNDSFVTNPSIEDMMMEPDPEETIIYVSYSAANSNDTFNPNDQMTLFPGVHMRRDSSLNPENWFRWRSAPPEPPTQAPPAPPPQPSQQQQQQQPHVVNNYFIQPLPVHPQVTSQQFLPPFSRNSAGFGLDNNRLSISSNPIAPVALFAPVANFAPMAPMAPVPPGAPPSPVREPPAREPNPSAPQCCSNTGSMTPQMTPGQASNQNGIPPDYLTHGPPNLPNVNSGDASLGNPTRSFEIIPMGQQQQRSGSGFLMPDVRSHMEVIY